MKSRRSKRRESISRSAPSDSPPSVDGTDPVTFEDRFLVLGLCLVTYAVLLAWQWNTVEHGGWIRAPSSVL